MSLAAMEPDQIALLEALSSCSIVGTQIEGLHQPDRAPLQRQGENVDYTQ